MAVAELTAVCGQMYVRHPDGPKWWCRRTSTATVNPIWSVPPAPGVALGKGDGTFQAPLSTTVFMRGPYLALGEFNNDGKLDAVVEGGGGVSILLGNVDESFRVTGPYGTAGLG